MRIKGVKKMKICILTENVSSVGGVQRVVTRLASELGYEHEVTLVSTLDRVDRSIYELNKNIKLDINHELMSDYLISRVYRTLIKIVNRKTNWLNNSVFYSILEKVYYPKKFKNKFVRYIKDNQYDIVIGAEGYHSVLLGIIRDEISCQTIGWQHSSFEGYFKTRDRYYWNLNILFEKNLHKLNHYVVLTNKDKINVDDTFNISSQVIYNPITFRTKEKSSTNNKKIVALGRLVEAKGFDLLIESFGLIASKYPDWCLEIYGDGPEQKKLYDLIKNLRLEQQVSLLSPVKDVKSILLHASIYAMSSRWEGFGLVITEALECGLPVVAFNTTGPAEILSGFNCGLLVEQKDIVAFSKALQDLIVNDRLRKHLADNAINRANNFNIQEILKSWQSLMES